MDARPSITAQRVAMRRAAHQLFDQPRILEDPIALPILGEEVQARIRAEEKSYRKRGAQYFRAFMVVRSRFAEDELAASVARGASQYVVLGAGLDTFAYRNPFGAYLRVFEVDHPATQAWKQKRLAAGGIEVPPSLTFAPVNFETQSLREGLAAADFEFGKVSFFSWLGVVPYLTRGAMMSTLEFIASLPTGSGVVFDYAKPRASLGLVGRIAFDALARRVAVAGEPFRLFFDRAELANELRAKGFRSMEDLEAEDLNARYFHNRADRLRIRGRLGGVVSART